MAAHQKDTIGHISAVQKTVDEMIANEFAEATREISRNIDRLEQLDSKVNLSIFQKRAVEDTLPKLKQVLNRLQNLNTEVEEPKVVKLVEARK